MDRAGHAWTDGSVIGRSVDPILTPTHQQQPTTQPSLLQQQAAFEKHIDATIGPESAYKLTAAAGDVPNAVAKVHCVFVCQSDSVFVCGRFGGRRGHRRE